MSSFSDLSSSLSSSEDHEVTPRTRILRTRVDPFSLYDDKEFYDRYRLPKRVVNELLALLGQDLEPSTRRNKALSAMQKLLITLRFYATGSFQQTVGDLIHVHKSTACRIIKKVTKRIARLSHQMITMPETNEEISKVKTGFYNICQFPNVIGALDCTHIKIVSPGGPNAELFRNRKGFFSLNVQVVCDAELKIMDIIARWPGSVHDSTIFNDSHLRANLELGRYDRTSYLLGDSGYPCRNYLLTPILEPSTGSEEAYNSAQIATRNPVERCFGVLKRRFPCLSMGLRISLDTTMEVIVACAVLHNIAINNNDYLDSDVIYPDEMAIATNNIIPHNLQQNTATRSSLLQTRFLI